MAIFKTLRQKEKRYVFDFLGNRGDPNPAVCVFARFPLPEENFMPRVKGNVFEGLNFAALGKRDEKEMDKFISAIMDHFSASMAKVDYASFVRECVDHFENFTSDGREIKTADDFCSLSPEMWTVIADDLYRYACQKDEVSMGE
jgi:hypothetical protein